MISELGPNLLCRLAYHLTDPGPFLASCKATAALADDVHGFCQWLSSTAPHHPSSGLRALVRAPAARHWPDHKLCTVIAIILQQHCSSETSGTDATSGSLACDSEHHQPCCVLPRLQHSCMNAQQALSEVLHWAAIAKGAPATTLLLLRAVAAAASATAPASELPFLVPDSSRCSSRVPSSTSLSTNSSTSFPADDRAGFQTGSQSQHSPGCGHHHEQRQQRQAGITCPDEKPWRVAAEAVTGLMRTACNTLTSTSNGQHDNSPQGVSRATSQTPQDASLPLLQLLVSTPLPVFERAAAQAAARNLVLTAASCGRLRVLQALWELLGQGLLFSGRDSDGGAGSTRRRAENCWSGDINASNSSIATESSAGTSSCCSGEHPGVLSHSGLRATSSLWFKALRAAVESSQVEVAAWLLGLGCCQGEQQEGLTVAHITNARQVVAVAGGSKGFTATMAAEHDNLGCLAPQVPPEGAASLLITAATSGDQPMLQLLLNAGVGMGGRCGLCSGHNPPQESSSSSSTQSARCDGKQGPRMPLGAAAQAAEPQGCQGASCSPACQALTAAVSSGQASCVRSLLQALPWLGQPPPCCCARAQQQSAVDSTQGHSHCRSVTAGSSDIVPHLQAPLVAAAVEGQTHVLSVLLAAVERWAQTTSSSTPQVSLPVQGTDNLSMGAACSRCAKRAKGKLLDAALVAAVAAEAGVSIVRQLLVAGADPNAQLSVSADCSRPDLVSLPGFAPTAAGASPVVSLAPTPAQNIMSPSHPWNTLNVHSLNSPLSSFTSSQNQSLTASFSSRGLTSLASSGACTPAACGTPRALMTGLSPTFFSQNTSPGVTFTPWAGSVTQQATPAGTSAVPEAWACASSYPGGQGVAPSCQQSQPCPTQITSQTLWHVQPEKQAPQQRETVLVLACRRGNCPVASALLEHGATPTGSTGAAALLAALQSPSCSVVALLLSAGADPDACRDEGAASGQSVDLLAQVLTSSWPDAWTKAEELLAAGAQPGPAATAVCQVSACNGGDASEALALLLRAGASPAEVLGAAIEHGVTWAAMQALTQLDLQAEAAAELLARLHAKACGPPSTRALSCSTSSNASVAGDCKAAQAVLDGSQQRSSTAQHHHTQQHGMQDACSALAQACVQLLPYMASLASEDAALVEEQAAHAFAPALPRGTNSS